MINDKDVAAKVGIKNEFEWSVVGIVKCTGCYLYQRIGKVLRSNLLNPLYEGDTF